MQTDSPRHHSPALTLLPRCRTAIQAVAILGLVITSSVAARAQTLDSPFYAAVAAGAIRAIALQPDGKIIVGGTFSSAGWGCGPTTCPITRNNIARFNTDGSVDLGFNPGANGEVMALAVQPDGKILVGGTFLNIGGGGFGITSRRGLARLNPDGSVDGSFDPAGTGNGQVTAILLQPDGSIIATVSRLKLSDGTVVVREGLGRIFSDGTIDQTYRPGFGGGTASNVTLALDSQGRLLVGGGFLLAGSNGTVATGRQRIARFLANGDLDPDFNPGVANPAPSSSTVNAIAIQPDGRILVGGSFRFIGNGTGTEARNFLARLNDTGAVEAFDAGIANGSNPGEVRSIAIQADGKIVIGGTFGTIGGQPRLSFGRLSADGPVDDAFASLSTVVNNTIYSVVLQDDGKILVGGVFTSNNGAQRNRIARINSTSVATQSLVVDVTGTSVTWTRGGTSPEAKRVTFETLPDGGSWTSLGAGTRIAGGWQVTGLSLPANPVIRARAFYDAAYGNGSGSIAQTLQIPTAVNFVSNNSFSNGTTGWLQFGLPDIGAMVSNITNGVFQFYRNGTQAVIFRETGVPLPAGAPIEAQFQLGNSDNVRKRISVLVHDSNFADLFVCTFWLPPNAPLQTYGLNTHTTQAWANATISFYAASSGSNGGFYQLDNVDVQYVPGGSATTTRCIDPTTPTASADPDSSELLVNGDFSSAINTGTGWSTFGQITGAVTSGVFQFIKNAGAPAGVVLQATGQPIPTNTLLTSTFQIGNSSSVRKRVTVILHDNDFSDLSACTFWIPAGQALSTYTYRSFTTKAWTNATLSVYPATVGAEQWIRLDNVSFKRTPSAAITGTECLEPGASSDPRFDWAPTPDSGWLSSTSTDTRMPTVSSGTDTAAAGGKEASASLELGGWIADGFAWTDGAWVATVETAGVRTLTVALPLDLADTTGARLTARSWLSGVTARAVVQFSIDGTHWETLAIVAPSDTWVPLEVNLGAWAGHHVHLRLVFESAEPADDVWRVEDVVIESN